MTHIASTLSTQEQLLYILHTYVLAREQDLSSWMMWNVLVLRPDLWTAITMELAYITVTTIEMLVSLDVKASKRASPVNLTVECRSIRNLFSYILLNTHTDVFAIGSCKTYEPCMHNHVCTQKVVCRPS